MTTELNDEQEASFFRKNFARFSKNPTVKLEDYDFFCTRDKCIPPSRKVRDHCLKKGCPNLIRTDLKSRILKH